MELIRYPDPILFKKCEEVEIGDPKIGKILDEMSQKLYEWNGAGLAGPQVGVSKRIAVIDVRDEPSRLYKLINPKIIWRSEECVDSKEGCLSFPLLRETVARHESVVATYLDEDFKEQEIRAEGYLSFCLQHEIDHLDGILYIDHLSKLKKSRFMKKFLKAQENEKKSGFN
ncbi:MAG: peptide deformylase [Holosporaceae bacterium]|jgi:peptide deformylase|nr:peptide deformylase [Holosporaceae bacterium]